MFGLPTSTEFNRRIPKQKFYENIDISPALKRIFIEQIKSIYWRNKIAPSTVNVAQGEKVTEIEVFEVKLTGKLQPEPVLRQIDKTIPYHIVFLLEYENQYQAWIAFKEASTGTNAFKVHSYYHTDWMDDQELSLKLEGLNIDLIYENLVRKIGGIAVEEDRSLDEQIDHDAKRAQLTKEIEKLERMARKEIQPKKKFELVQRIQELRRELN